MSSLWVDKYRPQSLDKLDYHKDQAAQLQRLAAAGDLPHMLFYGPSGAGKKTRVMALLRAIFGPGVERVKLQHRAFKTPSGKAIEVTTIASTYHIEINPGDAGAYERTRSGEGTERTRAQARTQARTQAHAQARTQAHAQARTQA